MLNDLRHAFRWLKRSPGFAAVAILSLGLGIGANTAIFSVVDALLLRPLPVADPAHLVDLYTSGSDGDTFSTNSLPDLEDYRAQAVVFEDVIGYTPMFAAISQGDRTRLVLGEVVTGNYFQILGVSARIGRTLLPEDDVPGARRVTVLSSRHWQREFGADPQVLGRPLRIRGQEFVIVGVLADQFTGMMPMLAPEVWVPVRYVEDVEPAGINEVVPSPTGTSRLDRRGTRWLFAKARVKSNVSIDEARANLEIVAAQLRAAHPQTNKDRRVSVRRVSETRAHPDADALIAWIGGGTMAAVGLVLLIACANVAGMLLARAAARQREISIRLAIGAGRARLVRQLLAESAVLGALGGALGAALAWWLMRALQTIELPLPVPLSLDLRPDIRVMTFTALAALATGLVAGLIPALRATRSDLATDLKGEVVTVSVRGRRWTARDVLVTGQIAVTAVLLVIGGLLVRSVGAAQVADVGFRTEGLAIVSTDPDMLRYSETQSAQFWTEAERRLRALPGVENVAFASRLPFSVNFSRTNVAVPGRQRAPDEMGAPINSANISPRYFATLGVGVVEGREFAPTDTPDTPRVTVVSEAFARRYWPGQSAIGKVVFERTLSSGRDYQIVGVVADHKQRTVGEAAMPSIYFSDAQRRSSYRVVMARTSGDERVLLAQMRATLIALDPQVLVLDNQTMKAQVATTLFPVRVAAALLVVFSALAVLLAAIGLYGVIAFAVSRRTREIGIRQAIGARPGELLAMVMRQGGALVVIGLVVGFVMAAVATRVVAGALYGVSAADPIAWGGAAVVILATGGLANLIPARRAMQINPVAALRVE